MKFDQLRSIAHNIATSLACGNCFVIGYYHVDVFAEAARSPAGFMEVDFLTGAAASGSPSPRLARALALLATALPRFCAKHGASNSMFRRLSARYFADRRFTVTVEDRAGRHVSDEYLGFDGKRVSVLDQLGRIRRQPGKPLRLRPPGLRYFQLSLRHLTMRNGV